MTIAAEVRLPDANAAVAPWSWNPSAWSQRIPIAVLALLGFGIAGYMGLYQWGLVDEVWDPVFGAGTERVLHSGVSERLRSWVGIPDAVLASQNHLVVGLLVAMFAIIPSRASRPPAAWRRFYERAGEEGR